MREFYAQPPLPWQSAVDRMGAWIWQPGEDMAGEFARSRFALRPPSLRPFIYLHLFVPISAAPSLPPSMDPQSVTLSSSASVSCTADCLPQSRSVTSASPLGSSIIDPYLFSPSHALSVPLISLSLSLNPFVSLISPSSLPLSPSLCLPQLSLISLNLSIPLSPSSLPHSTDLSIPFSPSSLLLSPSLSLPLLRVIEALPVIGLFTRIISDEGGVGDELIDIAEFIRPIGKNCSFTNFRVFYEFQGR